jgi:site-specific recombinase XerD
MHTINLRPAQPALAAEQLPSLVDAYIADCEPRISSITLRSYKYALGYLVRWWHGHGQGRGWLLTKTDLAHFARWLEHQPGVGGLLAYNSRDMILSRVRQLLRWAFAQEYIDRDFSGFVPAADGAPPIRKATTLAALERLLQAAGASSKPLRDITILATFIGTGIRRGELASLNVDDVVLHANLAGRLLIRKTKTDTPRQAVFDPTTGRYLAAYLASLDREHGPLFVNQSGDRLSVTGVWRIVKAAIARAKLEQEIQGPHDLRRLFVTVWMRNRKGLGSAQLLALQVGHTSPKMSLHYSLQTVEDLDAEFVSPMGLIEGAS